MDIICIVCNEDSSNSKPILLKNIAEKYLDLRKIHYVFHKNNTDIKKDLEQYIEQGCRFFIVAGGDGTVSLVSDYIAETNSIMAILPMGTANAVAEILGIDNDYEKNIQLIANGNYSIKYIDTLRMGTRYFLLNITIGLSSRVMEKTSSLSKKLFGRVAYILRGFIELLTLSSLEFEIIIDGDRNVERAVEVGIHNMGLQRKFLYQNIFTSLPTSGFAECYIFYPKGIRNYLSFLSDYLTGHISTSKGYLKKIIINKNIEITFSGDVPVQGDGDSLNIQTFSVDVVPKSLGIVVYNHD